MLIANLLDQDTMNFDLSLDDFITKYIFNLDLSDEQLKTEDEITALMVYGYIIAVKRYTQISLEKSAILRKIQFELHSKNIMILKERMIRNDKLILYNINLCQDSSLYSDVHGFKYINAHFNNIELFNRFISFYSLGFLVGSLYIKKRFDSIFSTTLSGARRLGKLSESIMIKETTLPELIAEYDAFILKYKTLLNLKRK